MKIKIVLFALPLAGLLAGCVGYNHTLFMTKSNAGLDVDMKPPTTEVTIARKEAVISPVFEGGKTPPVMASFGANSDVGNSFTRFLFGVDQTFAGGDAARAMTELYSDTTPVKKTDKPTDYDSKITVNGNPDTGRNKFMKFFFGLHKNDDVRPLIFGTDTSLGVKAGWSGVSGQVPDRLHAGFNRKEMAFAPVFGEMDEGRTKTDVRMPSFLATVDSNSKVSGNGDTSVSYLQYFATGDAATRLAMQPAVRQAMLQRADPLASEKAKKIEEKQIEAGARPAKVAERNLAIGSRRDELAKAASDAATKAAVNAEAAAKAESDAQAKKKTAENAGKDLADKQRASADADAMFLAAKQRSEAAPGDLGLSIAKTNAENAAKAAKDAVDKAKQADSDAKQKADAARAAADLAKASAEFATKEATIRAGVLTVFDKEIKKATGRTWDDFERYGNTVDVMKADKALQAMNLISPPANQP